MPEDADGALMQMMQPTRFPRVVMTEAQRMEAAPKLMGELQSNPYYAILVNAFGMPYVLDWMTVWGPHYEPFKPDSPGLENFAVM
jgi:hypothetical protein